MKSVLAVNGGNPVRTKPYPAWPIFGEEEERAVAEVVRSGLWGLGGTKIPEFQEKFARYQNAKHGICVANGTVSLIVALRAAGVGPDDEVIIPPYTFMATATAVLELCATPVFVDIDPDTYCIDTAKIESAVTERTKAIIPVHIAGQPADMDGIMEIADRRNLVVIEDAAHAHGAEWNGRRVGAIGHMGSFSFQSSKNLTCGEGGIILTNHDDFADMCYSFHNCGRIRGGDRYEHHVLGQNFRMSEFQAAVLLAQLEKLEGEANLREENGKYLSRKLSEIEGIQPQKRYAGTTRHAFHLLMFKYDADAFSGIDLKTFITALSAEGIPVMSGYKPLYKEPLFAGRGEHPSCPTCEALSAQTVWLTQNILLSDREGMDDVVKAVSRIRENSADLRKG